jgi:tetratricopeptide (TPR) repeat protein
MYFKEITIQNLRSFQEVELKLNYPGMAQHEDKTTPFADHPIPENVNLILGNNGSGKSTVLMALAISIIGRIPGGAGFHPFRLIQDDNNAAVIQAKLQFDPADFSAEAAAAFLPAFPQPDPRQRLAEFLSYDSEIRIFRQGDAEFTSVRWDHDEIEDLERRINEAQARPKTGSDREVYSLASNLVVLADLEYGIRRYNSALKHIEEAEVVYRTLTSRGNFAEGLANALNYKAKIYLEFDKKELAIEANSEAIRIYQGLKQIDFPDQYVNTLLNQTMMEGESGGGVEALKYAITAERVAAELVASAPKDYFQMLHVKTLTELSFLQNVRGQYRKALISANSAIAIYQDDPLDKQEDRVKKLIFANNWNRKADILMALGDLEGARTASQLSLSLCIELGKDHWDALAVSFNTSGLIYTNLGRYKDAIHSFRHAIAYYNAAISKNPAVFQSILMSILNNQSILFSDLGLFAKALDIIDDAIKRWQDFNKANQDEPDKLDEDLAICLLNKGEILNRLERYEDARLVLQRALGYYQKNQLNNSDGNSEQLADTWRQLSFCQLGLQEPAAALASVEQALGLYQGLAAGNPQGTSAPLAQAWRQRSHCQGQLGDHQAAQASIEEAKARHQALAERYPKRFTRELYADLQQLQRCEQALGGIQATTREALAAVEQQLAALRPEYEEAVEAAKPLVKLIPMTFTVDPEKPANPWGELGRNDAAAFLLVGYAANRRTESGEFDPGSRQKSRGVRYGRVANLFEDHYTLTPLGAWLPKINSNEGRFQEVLDLFKRLLPAGTDDSSAATLSFTGEKQPNGEYLFLDHGRLLPLSALSDGYRAYLGWVIDLLGVLVAVCPQDKLLTELGGVVMVDEIDSHVHPTWQREIIGRIASTFPKLQFIFTTHSPIVAGTVYSANLFVAETVTDERDGKRYSILSRPKQEIFGLNADQILTSSVFGLTSSRAPAFIEELKVLEQKAIAEGDVEAAMDLMRGMARGAARRSDTQTTTGSSNHTTEDSEAPVLETPAWVKALMVKHQRTKDEE